MNFIPKTHGYRVIHTASRGGTALVLFDTIDVSTLMFIPILDRLRPPLKNQPAKENLCHFLNESIGFFVSSPRTDSSGHPFKVQATFALFYASHKVVERSSHREMHFPSPAVLPFIHVISRVVRQIFNQAS